jgi:hypothetical protein
MSPPFYFLFLGRRESLKIKISAKDASGNKKRVTAANNLKPMNL